MKPKFVYKINASYDNFAPAKIEGRLRGGRLLKLGWKKYLDAVEEGDRVWVFFRGNGIEPGVYVKGAVERIDYRQKCVQLGVKYYSDEGPLDDAATTKEVAAVVQTPYLQVFPWPEAGPAGIRRRRKVPAKGAGKREPRAAKPAPASVECGPGSCAKRLCEKCPKWRSLSIINSGDARPPARFPHAEVPVISAYWIVPNRCQFKGAKIKPQVHRATDMFMAFKTGQEEYAYPLAAGMYRALRARKLDRFDAVIPVPLSPDKKRAGELHRTRALATELAALLGCQVKELLTLRKAISKRRFLSQNHGHTADFERRYLNSLQVRGKVAGLRRAILVDDVMTHGSTAAQAISRLTAAAPRTKFVVATAGQMIVQSAVGRKASFLKA